MVLLLSLAFLVRDYTPANELKYISIAQEALDNGTWFSFYNHGEIYADKPPLYMWIVMLGKLLFGDSLMWFVGLFSLLPMVGTMAVMGRLMRMECDRPNTYAADMMLATTVMFVGAGVVLRMDMLMTFFITLALYTFFRMYNGVARPHERWLLPVWIFMALFTKGPYGVMIPLASMVAFLAVKRELRTFGRYFGWGPLAVLLALCALWWGAVYAEGGYGYIYDLLFRQTVGRGIDSFHHKAPAWYYLMRLPMTMAPWIFLYAVVLVTGIRRRMVCTDTERFCLTVAVTTTVMLSLISAKLDVYLIPMYPFLVYPCAMWLCKVESSAWVKAAAALPAVVFALAIAALPAVLSSGLYTLPTGDTLVKANIYIAVAILSAGGVWSAVLILARSRTSRGVIVASWAFLVTFAALTPAIPAFNSELGFAPICKKAMTAGVENYACHRLKYGENMDVYLKRPVARIDETAQLAAITEPTVLFVTERVLAADPALAKWLAERQPVAGEGKYRAFLIGDAVPAGTAGDENE